MLKGLGHVAITNLLSLLSTVAHTHGIMFCRDFKGWYESKVKLLLEIHQYPCSLAAYGCFIFENKIKESIFKTIPCLFLRKVVGNLCDVACQKYFKVVVSKDPVSLMCTRLVLCVHCFLHIFWWMAQG